LDGVYDLSVLDYDDVDDVCFLKRSKTVKNIRKK